MKFCKYFKNCIYFNIFLKISLKFVPEGPKISIGSGNGWAPNWWQATTWTNADQVHRCIYPSPGLSELMPLLNHWSYISDCPNNFLFYSHRVLSYISWNTECILMFICIPWSFRYLLTPAAHSFLHIRLHKNVNIGLPGLMKLATSLYISLLPIYVATGTICFVHFSIC